VCAAYIPLWSVCLRTERKDTPHTNQVSGKIKHLHGYEQSVGDTRPLDCPFIRRKRSMLPAYRAERRKRKGKKTHVQTIHSMDTATCSTRADWDVLCVVAYAGYSCGRACNTLTYHSASYPSTRRSLSLVSEPVYLRSVRGEWYVSYYSSSLDSTLDGI
jgi:hypothetical protein